ncbi:MAG: hypothetical protein GY696_41110 [Gammaproteobacteria bacterium]|nr:hypothetical protein [Gammaproteobacteria bacterium]
MNMPPPLSFDPRRHQPFYSDRTVCWNCGDPDHVWRDCTAPRFDPPSEWCNRFNGWSNRKNRRGPGGGYGGSKSRGMSGGRGISGGGPTFIFNSGNR